jgi:hypothetical protein
LRTGMVHHLIVLHHYFCLSAVNYICLFCSRKEKGIPLLNTEKETFLFKTLKQDFLTGMRMNKSYYENKQS